MWNFPEPISNHPIPYFAISDGEILSCTRNSKMCELIIAYKTGLIRVSQIFCVDQNIRNGHKICTGQFIGYLN